jgi:hypothetical protein
VDQWTSFSEPGRFPLVLKPVVACSRLNKVLIDGGRGLNILFTKTLKKMKLDITHMLTKSTSPFYGIVHDNGAIPLGSVCRCLNLSTSMGGTRSKVEGGDRHDLEPEGTREDTRHEIYTGSGSRSSYPTSCLEYCALRLDVDPRRDCGCPPRYPALLYIVQGAGS